eukprot:479270_1
MNTTTTLITPEIIALNTKIKQYTNKLNSIDSNTCLELNNEINKLNNQKQYQLQSIHEMKINELQIATQRHNQQINQLNIQKDAQISNFKLYCIKYLEKLKKDIKSKKTNQKDIKISEIYNDFQTKTEKKNNNRCIRYTRTRSNKYNNKLIFPPQPCLTKAEIESDLMDIFNNAKEQNIEIPMDILNENDIMKIQREKCKKKTLKYKTGVTVSESDKIEISKICDKIGINIPEKALKVALYGYAEHLDVYLDIYHMINNCNINEQNNSINQLKSTKLRDVQVKLSSKGTIGRKNEMANGIKIKLKELTSKYKAKCKQ